MGWTPKSVCFSDIQQHSPNESAQTAAIFIEGGVKLRRFSPVRLDLSLEFSLLIKPQPRKGLVHLA